MSLVDLDGPEWLTLSLMDLTDCNTYARQTILGNLKDYPEGYFMPFHGSWLEYHAPGISDGR